MTLIYDLIVFVRKMYCYGRPKNEFFTRVLKVIVQQTDQCPQKYTPRCTAVVKIDEDNHATLSLVKSM